MESLQNPNPTKRSHNLVQGQLAKGQAATKQGQLATGDLDLVENSTKGLLYHPDTCYKCGKGRTPKGTGLQGCGHYLQRVWQGKDIMRRFACKGNTLHTLSRHRPILQGLGPVNPYTSMMRDSQSTPYMVSVPHANNTFD